MIHKETSHYFCSRYPPPTQCHQRNRSSLRMILERGISHLPLIFLFSAKKAKKNDDADEDGEQEDVADAIDNTVLAFPWSTLS